MSIHTISQEEFMAEYSKAEDFSLNYHKADVERFKKGLNELFKAAGYDAVEKFYHGESQFQSAYHALCVDYGDPSVVPNPDPSVEPCEVVQRARKTLMDQVPEVEPERFDEINKRASEFMYDPDLMNKMRKYIYAQQPGSSDVKWIATYKLMQEFKDTDHEKTVAPLDISESCAFYAAYHSHAFVQDSPTSIQIERVGDRNVVTCEDGPAIEWSDGSKFWAIRNMGVDEQLVMRPETQTVEQINAEENIELKRIRIERFGWDKYLTGMNATIVDGPEENYSGVDKTIEVLFSCNIDGDEDTKVLVSSCPSTGRVFAMELGQSFEGTTCEEAQRWLGPQTGTCVLSG